MGESTYCKDKRFGTFFWINHLFNGIAPPEKRLYACSSPTRATWIAFPERYAYVVFAKTGTDLVSFWIAAEGHSYRCGSQENIRENKEFINTREALPLNAPLCAGFAVVERGATVKVTVGGHTLQMIPIRG